MNDLPDTKLQDIIESCVCRECGGKLEIHTIDDRPQPVCWNCQKTWTGIDPEIYKLSKRYVEEQHFHYYKAVSPHFDKDYERDINIGKMCEIIQWLKPHLGALGIEKKGGGA